jgi:hypothetical protein
MASTGSNVHDAVTVIRRDGERTAPAGDLRPGDRVGPYELIEPIGAGGMATVWRADDPVNFRDVALKILPDDLAASPDHLARFRVEAEAAAALDHPNVAKAFACGEANGRHFIAFEYVPGVNLRQVIEANGPLAPADAVRYLRDCIDGLAHAAERGVVHRDVKPANIVITPDGRAKLIDMGLARRQDGTRADGGITHSGVTIGTFDYLAPEQAIDPRLADFRSDVYSLGCTFYHALTGRPPVPEGTAARKLQFHQHQRPLDPRLINPAIPDDFAAILSRMVRKTPADRYPDAATLRADLDRLGTVRPRPAAFSRSAITATVAVAACVALAISPTGRDTTGSFVSNGTGPTAGDASPGEPAAAVVRAADGYLLPQTAEELADALRSGEEKVRLRSGAVYDLTAVDPVIHAGETLTVESPADRAPARIVLPANENGLTIRSVPRVEFRNVAFEVVPDDGVRPNPSPCGLRLDGSGTAKFIDCRFDLDDQLRAGKVASVAIAGGDFSFRHCLFPRGAVAVRLHGQARGTATDCAFGPHDVVFDAAEAAGSLSLEHVTVRLRGDGGTVVAQDATSRIAVRTTCCLFAASQPVAPAPAMAMTPRPAPTLVRLPANRTADWAHPADRGDAVYGIDAAAVGDANLPFDRREDAGLAGASFTALRLVPWIDGDELDDDRDPWRPFRLRLDVGELRIPRDVVYGVRSVSSDGLRLYAGDWPPPRPAEWTANPVKTWWPAAPVGVALPPDTTRRLADLIELARPGDAIEIRHDGTLPCPTIRWTQPGLLTVRPATGFRPVLLIDDGAKAAAAASLVDVHRGEIAFDTLEFSADAANRAIVRLEPGAGVRMSRCVVTLDGGAAAVRSEPDDGDRMAMAGTTGTTRVRIDESIVRGRGTLFAGTSPRASVVELADSLVALDGRVVAFDGQEIDRDDERRDRVTVQRCTVALAGTFLHAKPGRGRLLPIELDVQRSLFAPVGRTPGPFVAVVGGEAAVGLESYVTWLGDGSNRYANWDRSAAFAEVQSAEPTGPAMTATLELDDWVRRITREPATAIGRERFRGKAITAASLIEALPDDFAVTRRRPEESTPFGADPTRLPTPAR